MKNILKALLGTVFVFKLVLLPSILFKSEKAGASLPKVIMPQEELVELQGYIIGEPKFNEATNEYQFKFAPKKNKNLEGVFMIVSVAKPKDHPKYYMGDYVKIKTRLSILDAAVGAKSRVLANE